MKEMAKRTAVAALAGVMSVGMLTGCGSKTLDGTKTVATVDGTDIPLGVVSLYAREQQQRTTAMYMSYMGSADNIWFFFSYTFFCSEVRYQFSLIIINYQF